MFLTDFDILEGDEESRPEIDLKTKERENYVPKMCSSENDFDKDINGIKAKADLLYYRKSYVKAIEVYDELLADKKVKGATVRRDILESKARCYLALGDYKEALEISENILLKTPDHDDFRIVALALKIDILKQQSESGANLSNRELKISMMRLLQMHSNLSRYWILLAQEYLEEEKPSQAMCCLSLAKQFGSHILDLRIGDKIDQLRKQYPHISFDNCNQQKCSEDDQSTDDQSEEFSDLGRSVRMKEIECTLASGGSGQPDDGGQENLDCDTYIVDFEKKWFSL